MRGGGASSGRGEFRPVYHPAGHDAELRVALEEVGTGRWMAIRDLLARTGTQWDLRTSRSQVLAAAAARSGVVQAWLVEEPGSVDAQVMRARVAVERALHAGRAGHGSTEVLAWEAREASLIAADLARADPVPWVCLLALAQLDRGLRRVEHRVRPTEPMLPLGPWRLLDQVNARDPCSREAYHRVLQFLHAQAVGSQAVALDFARWVGSWAPSGTALSVLPLYAYAENCRSQRARGAEDRLMRRQWAQEPIVLDVQRALTGWFHHPVPAARSVLDLNYLAHALWAAHQFTDAAQVFTALGPYAARLPWAYVTDDPGRPDLAEAEFVRARGQALAATEVAARAGPHR
ncbi:hypothetical protein C8250_009160 [Streptomyces sp. So13.3]|nr:hypothetical protein [Streptomyces sp. So13.3]QNA72050.1 hypothetical protein C8250_009160 [Streptomyces sp. So13.3]